MIFEKWPTDFSKDKRANASSLSFRSKLLFASFKIVSYPSVFSARLTNFLILRSAHFLTPDAQTFLHWLPIGFSGWRENIISRTIYVSWRCISLSRIVNIGWCIALDVLLLGWIRFFRELIKLTFNNFIIRLCSSDCSIRITSRRLLV